MVSHDIRKPSSKKNNACNSIYSQALILLFSLLITTWLTGCIAPVDDAPAAGNSPTLITHTPNAASNLNANSARSTTLARQIPALDSTLTAGTLSPTQAARATSLAATLNPPTPTITRTRRPILSSELLYLAGGKLMRWDHLTGYASLLADRVEAFSVSANGREIILLRPHYITANGENLYDLDLLDFSTKQVHSLLEKIPRFHQITISPDGKWVVYIDQENGGLVHARRTDTPNHHVELGECQQQTEVHCQRLLWSPDSRYVVWSETRGIWTSAPSLANPQLLHAPRVDVLDPKGKTTSVDVVLEALSWSPLGRFVLVRAIPSPQGVRWYEILDTRLGRMTSIPGSSEFTTPSVDLYWMQDGSFLVADGSESQGSEPFTLQSWSIVPTNNQVLLPGKTYELRSNDFPTIPITTSNQNVRLTWLSQQDSETLALGIWVAASTSPTLFQMSLYDGKLLKIVDLPIGSSQVLWAPDGSGALIIGQSSQVFWLSRSKELRDLNSILGNDASTFFWMPPLSR